MIDNYEIGGNSIKIDSSEAIADIPNNRTLLIEKLTTDEPINPEAITGLNTVEEVFEHYKPQVAVEFANEDGQLINETFHFSNVGDFDVKKLTEQSKFLKDTKTKKDFYDNVMKQLRSNKVLQRALENPESKAALIEAIESILVEINENEVQ